MKKSFYGAILALVLLLPVFSAHAALVPIAEWKFDETVAGSNAKDAIGADDGTPTNNPTPSTDVPPVDFADARSVSFNGSNYFTFARPISTNFSICAWIKTSSTGGGSNHWQSAPIFDSETGGVGVDFGFGIGNGGKLMFGNGGTVGGSLVDRQVNGNTTINDNQWHNVCATRNNSNGEVDLYVDAHLDGQGTTGTGALTRNPNFRTAFGYDGAALYVGLIDDLRVYDVVLTSDQLQNITGGSDDPDAAPDNTAPVISDVATNTITDAHGSITWSTDEDASSKVAYSVDSSFASSTEEDDLDPRVMDHQVTLKDLLSCTLYNFKAVSSDASGNYATSTAGMFVTTGCIGGAVPSSATSTLVTVSSAATSRLSDAGRTLTVSTPANVTATSSSIVIQIKGQDSSATLDSIGRPGSLSSAASIVFDVKALIDNTTVLDSFDLPVTISYTYTDADVSGLDESTLSMYHYHNGAWEKLNGCSVDTATNVITCNTPSFSIFGIFGSPASSGSTASFAGGSVQSQVASLIGMGNVAEADALKKKWYWLFPQPMQAAAVRDLKLGMTGSDVMALQKFLNGNGAVLATSGSGSPGNETSVFGALTRAALVKFQKAHGINPSVGYFGPITRAFIATK